MVCPYPRNGYACGRCVHCRINRRRVWTARILLETREHACSVFVTLTYDEEHLPMSERLVPTLRPDDFQRWLKRLRRSHSQPLRYFGVGEYGTKTERPHYHAILFGVDPYTISDDVLNTWKMGTVNVKLFHQRHAAYVSGYTVKKFNKSAALEEGDGREPEFARMSRRPGVGFAAVDHFVNAYLRDKGAVALDEGGMAASFALNGKRWPLGYEMRRRIGEALGVDHCVSVSDNEVDLGEEAKKERKAARQFAKSKQSL